MKTPEHDPRTTATASTNSPCAPRRRFATREQAMAACVNISQRQGKHRLPEPCSACSGWHLSGVLP